MIRHILLALALVIATPCAAAFAQDAADESLAPETNPAVLAALELPRTEPRHYLGSVLSLLDLGRPELAAPILTELVDLNLDDAQRADLVDQLGSHRMLQLARATALAPAGQEFAEACMAAAAEKARDPQRLAQLVDQLSSPSSEVRTAARVDLATAGESGIVAVLEAFAREADPNRRTAIAEALVFMDPAAVDPLLGMLSTSDAALRHDVIRVLRAMHVTLASPFIATETSSSEAERLLDEAIGRNKRGMRSFVTDENNTAVLWLWDDATKTLTARRFPIDEAQTIWAARLALEYSKLRPDLRLAQCQALVLGLEAERLLGGTRSPAIEQLLSTADGEMLNLVLNAAMEHNFAQAAVSAAELLGRSEDASVLYASSPHPAPLADALVYPDRRVRFAALAAIMKLDPQSPFPGASRVPEALGYFATGASERHAVVAMPVADHATTLAGRLAKFGLDANAASRGGPAVALAQQSADLEIILVDADIDGPGIRDVIFALRSEPATGHLPIGVLARSDRLDAAHQLAAEHSGVIAFPRPQSDVALANLVERLNDLSGRNTVPPAERAAMAGQALDWLGQLLARRQSFYELEQQAPVVEAALYSPEMTERSVSALALLGTPASQRSLVDFASHLSVPIEPRRAAASAFAESVQRHGILLGEEEILRQYDRYNASQSADVETQQLLGGMLDTIEAPRAQADRIRTAPAQTEP